MLEPVHLDRSCWQASKHTRTEFHTSWGELTLVAYTTAFFTGSGDFALTSIGDACAFTAAAGEALAMPFASGLGDSSFTTCAHSWLAAALA